MAVFDLLITTSVSLHPDGGPDVAEESRRMKLTAFIRRLFGRFGPAILPPRASLPLRLPCAGLDAVPPAEELAATAVVGRHVVPQFPRGPGLDKRLLIDRLATRLPGHRVFDSGHGPGDTDCVTVYRVLDEGVVLAHLPLFLAAVRDFAATATDLCRRLAAAHGIDPAALLPGGRTSGRVAGGSASGTTGSTA